MNKLLRPARVVMVVLIVITMPVWVVPVVLFVNAVILYDFLFGEEVSQ